MTKQFPEEEQYRYLMAKLADNNGSKWQTLNRLRQRTASFYEVFFQRQVNRLKKDKKYDAENHRMQYFRDRKPLDFAWDPFWCPVEIELNTPKAKQKRADKNFSDLKVIQFLSWQLESKGYYLAAKELRKAVEKNIILPGENGDFDYANFTFFMPFAPLMLQTISFCRERMYAEQDNGYPGTFERMSKELPAWIEKKFPISVEEWIRFSEIWEENFTYLGSVCLASAIHSLFKKYPIPEQVVIEGFSPKDCNPESKEVKLYDPKLCWYDMVGDTYRDYYNRPYRSLITCDGMMFLSPQHGNDIKKVFPRDQQSDLGLWQFKLLKYNIKHNYARGIRLSLLVLFPEKLRDKFLKAGICSISDHHGYGAWLGNYDLLESGVGISFHTWQRYQEFKEQGLILFTFNSAPHLSDM